MTYLFYVAITCNSELSELDNLAIDKSVFENRLAIANLFKKIYLKSKVLIISTSVGLFILISAPKNIGAVGLSGIPQAPIMKPCDCIGSTKSCVPSYTRLSIETSDKTFFELTENRITNTNIDELVKLRGGDPNAFLVELVKFFLMLLLGSPTTKGFVPKPSVNPVMAPIRGTVRPAAPRVAPKRLDNQIPRNAPRPRPCKKSQNNQDGTLTAEQRRNSPSSGDVILTEQDVIIRYGQAKHKIKDHGHSFGVPSRKNERGRYRTEKTIENVEDFIQKIVDLVVNGERIEGTFRSGHPESFEAIHFFDPNTRNNAIFKKETKQFVSAWDLHEKQIIDLKTNKNVGDY